jgi:hypothetical protein
MENIYNYKAKEKTMKSIMFCLTIMLVVTTVSSCSKKDNNNTQQPQSGQEQSSLTKETEQNEQEPTPEPQQNEQSPKMEVVPVPNQDVIVLNAEQITEILKKSGFSNTQIQECGYSIREGLAKSGAVRIMIDNKVEAGFAVRGDEVYISTRARGYFIYNIKTGWVNSTK